MSSGKFARAAAAHIRDAIQRVHKGEDAGTVDGLTQNYLLAPALDGDLARVFFVIFGTNAPFAGGIYFGYLTLPATADDLTSYPNKPPDFSFITRNGLFVAGAQTPCVSIGRYHSGSYKAACKLGGFLGSVAGVFTCPETLGGGINVGYAAHTPAAKTASDKAARVLAAQSQVLFAAMAAGKGAPATLPAGDKSMFAAATEAYDAIIATYPDLPTRVLVTAQVAENKYLEEIQKTVRECAGMPLYPASRDTSVLAGCRKKKPPASRPASPPEATPPEATPADESSADESSDDESSDDESSDDADPADADESSDEESSSEDLPEPPPPPTPAPTRKPNARAGLSGSDLANAFGNI